ncbi:MAG: glycolate oxidase subunit GlcE [Xanthobacteraceae bacterium]|nr:glycolate oxidase subunit GlcE [Xanthobacteraceae bacterium]
MQDAIKPRDANDVAEAVASAVADEKRLELVGRGSKRELGRATQTDATLDLSALSGITLYEPEELVLSARAATPISEIEKALEESKQELAFEPMDYGLLLNKAPGEGTIGGAIAAGLSGPRRIKAGAARDFMLGVSAVSGRGEIFKAGGRVVKNVTGYDLPRLLAGSWGTLAVMTDVTLKVLPRAEDCATVLLYGASDSRANEAMSAAMGSSCEVSAAAHLPQWPADNVAELDAPGKSVTALRLEGVPQSVAYRKSKLEELLKPFGALGSLDAAKSRAFWKSVRDVAPFADRTERAVWKISTTPSLAPGIAAGINGATGAHYYYDWAGGLLWLEMPGDKPQENAVRTALAGRGHATLIRASAAARASAEVFEPLDPVRAAISQRLKNSFDPKGVLNPGRIYAGS